MSQDYSDDPKVWGKYYWYVIKSVVHNYPDKPDLETIKHTKAFFYSLQKIIPCSNCREHYKQYLKKYNIEPVFINKTKLAEWVTKFENDVKTRVKREHEEETKKVLIKEPQTIKTPETKITNTTTIMPQPKMILPQTSRPKAVSRPLLMNSKASSTTCPTCK